MGKNETRNWESFTKFCFFEFNKKNSFEIDQKIKKFCQKEIKKSSLNLLYSVILWY